MKKNSIKYSRMVGEVQRELSKIISFEVKDPRIHPMTSVVSVEVTPDLKYAKVFVSVLGSEQEKKRYTGRFKECSFSYPYTVSENIKFKKYAGINICDR